MSAYAGQIGKFPGGNSDVSLADQASGALATAIPVGNIAFWNASVQPVIGLARDETIAEEHPER